MNNRMLFSKVLGKVIREKRLEKRKTLEELADDTGLDDKHLGKVERGEKTPGSYTLAKLQIELEFSSDDYLPKYQQLIKKRD